jgi:hypothetical protein
MLNPLAVVAYRRVRARQLPLVASMLVLAGAAQAQGTVTITHPEVPAPTLLDLGEPGESVGDIRLWHVNNAKADDGSDVRIDWMMTTTGVNTPATGVDSRINTGVFSVGADTSNQLILQGVALYPGKGATMEVSSSAVRVVVGGSGRFAGARGWVESTHLEDGSWKHVFHLE